MTTILLAKGIVSSQTLELVGDCTIKGNLPSNITIQHRDGRLTIQGCVAEKTNLTTNGDLEVLSIGAYSNIKAASIQAGKIGSHSQLSAINGPIMFLHGGGNIEVISHGAVIFETLDRYATITAFKIIGKKIGDYSSLTAKHGGVQVLNGGGAIKIVADGPLEFCKLADYSDLMASEIIGTDIGCYSKLCATEATVTLKGKIGGHCSIENADGTTYARHTPTSSSTIPFALRNVGCGIHIDLRDKSYLIPDSLITIHQENYLKIFEKLLGLGYCIRKEKLFESSKEIPAHRIVPDGTKISAEILRKHMADFIHKSKKLGEDGAV